MLYPEAIAEAMRQRCESSQSLAPQLGEDRLEQEVKGEGAGGRRLERGGEREVMEGGKGVDKEWKQPGEGEDQKTGQTV